ncbi:MAG: hypothetical protein L0211_01945, partial [Planctomycetaceae bacterium]|nr:hypothetical protein [Planctomycetaceae bacterium]
KDALAMGLIDGVQSQDATYEQLVAATTSRTPLAAARSLTLSSNISRSKTMQAATLAELKANFPNSTADWRESQLEAGADLSTAAIAYASFVETNSKKTTEALQKQVDELTKANAAKPKPGAGNTLGQQPLKSAPGASIEPDELALESGDAVEDFNAAVAKIVGQNVTLQKRQSAIRLVARQKPELYKSYLLALNPSKRQQRLIEEKLEPAAK